MSESGLPRIQYGQIVVLGLIGTAATGFPGYAGCFDGAASASGFGCVLDPARGSGPLAYLFMLLPVVFTVVALVREKSAADLKKWGHGEPAAAAHSQAMSWTAAAFVSPVVLFFAVAAQVT